MWKLRCRTPHHSWRLARQRPPRTAQVIAIPAILLHVTVLLPLQPSLNIQEDGFQDSVHTELSPLTAQGTETCPATQHHEGTPSPVPQPLSIAGT